MTIYAGFTSLAEAAANTNVPISGAVETTAGKIGAYCSEGISISNTGLQLLWSHTSLILDGWCAFDMYADSGATTFATGSETIMFSDRQNARDVLSIATVSSASTTTLEFRRETANTVLVTSTGTIARATRYRVDIHWRIADAGGIFEMYLDNVLFATFTGDTLGNTSAGVSAIYVRRFNASMPIVVSGMIVADVDTRGMIFANQAITGNGSSSGMAGGFGDVDELGVNDADGLTISATNQKSTFTKAALNAAFNTGYDILAVTASARAIKGVLSASVRSVITSSGVQVQSANLPLEPVYLATHVVAETDPNTGSAWTVANANAAQVGVESRA